MSDSKWFSIWGKGGFGIYSDWDGLQTQPGTFRFVEEAKTNLSFKEINKTNITINNIERKKIFGYIIKVQTEILMSRKGFSWDSDSNFNDGGIVQNEEAILYNTRNLLTTPFYRKDSLGIFPFFDSGIPFYNQFNLSASKQFILEVDSISVKQLSNQSESGNLLKISYHNTIPYTEIEFRELIEKVKYISQTNTTGGNNDNYFNNN